MPKLEVVNANNVIEYSPQKANFKLKNTGGPKGEPGAQGPKGDTGPQGPAGPQGIQGEKGDKGAQGERGPQGIQGPQGLQGIQGPKGDKGDKGNTGATGPQGPQGPAGQDGTDGFSPIATVTQEGLDAEISITDKDGTTTATVPGFGVQVVESLPATGSSNVIYLERDSNSASGNPISIADAVEAPLKSLEIQGNTSQQTYSGKNLLKYPYSEYTLGNGITFSSNTDGTVVLNGQNNGSANSAYFLFRNDNSPIELPAGTYYFIPPSNTAVGYVLVVGSIYLDFNASNNYTRTFNSTQSVRQIYVQVPKGNTATFSNLKIYPMLSTLSGQTAADYEPYVGGVPAPNPDYPQAVQTVTGENTLTISDGTNTQSYDVNLGKNLLSSAWESGKYSDTGEKTPDSNAIRTVQMVAVEPRSTYIISNNGAAVAMNVFYYRADGTFIARQAVSGGNAFTTGSKARFVNFYRNANVAMDKAQLERGSSITSYAPYFPPIELCKIGDYQDHIYRSGGKWYVHKEVGKYTFTGNEVVGKASNTSNNSFYYASSQNVGTFGFSDVDTSNMGTGSASTTVLAVWSDRFLPAATASVITTDTIGIAFNKTNSGVDCRLGFGLSSSVNTAQLLTTWLTNNAPSVYYPLATATDTAITNAALIEQLEAILAGGTQGGANTITLTPSAGATGTLEVEYYDSYDSYLWVNNRWEKFAHLG